MRDVLLFTLYAPLCTLGQSYRGERRRGGDWPSRSALLGLFAAAAGYTRADEDQHEALARTARLFVFTAAAGRPLVDFHTTQTPVCSRREPSWPHRGAELAAAEQHTILSWRTWQADSFFICGVWTLATEPSEPSWLTELGQRLNRPRFALYLGSKAGVLGLPLNPQRVQAATALDALRQRTHTEVEEQVLAALAPNPGRRPLAFDLCPQMTPVVHAMHTRRDEPLSRRHHTFTTRDEGLVWLDPDLNLIKEEIDADRSPR